jgi:hypothetical protein
MIWSRGSQHLQQSLHQRGFSGSRGTGNNQHQRCENFVLTHSMFCISRFFNLGFHFRPMPVIFNASLSTPGVLEASCGFAMHLLQENQFLAQPPAPSSNFRVFVDDRKRSILR